MHGNLNQIQLSKLILNPFLKTIFKNKKQLSLEVKMIAQTFS